MNPIQTSGSKTADAVICARPCLFWGTALIAGSDTATVVLYDNASTNSGTKVFKQSALTTVQESTIFNQGVVCNNGLYADVSGTGPEYYVYFSIL